MKKLFVNKNVAFLENGNSLEDESQKLADWLTLNNLPFICIFDVQEQGTVEILRKCRVIDIIIFQSTFVYPVSQELKKAFLSIKNHEFKKTFIEVFIDQPTLSIKPKDVIHDIYVFDCFNDEWELYKLSKNKRFYETKNLWK